LLYLTGMNAAETTLVVLPGDPAHPDVLFTTDRNPLQERWTGRVPGPADVVETTGVRDVFSARRVDAFIDALFTGNGFDAKGTGGNYAKAFSPAVNAAFRAGKLEVWLLLGDRGTR